MHKRKFLIGALVVTTVAALAYAALKPRVQVVVCAEPTEGEGDASDVSKSGSDSVDIEDVVAFVTKPKTVESSDAVTTPVTDDGSVDETDFAPAE